ncbi:MAG: AAA family ATPase [Actinobacteria bacterium]|nr:AAA family ATPase [Actinomycetota bacterium]
MSEQALPDLVDALRWRWKPAVLIAACIFAGALLYVSTLPAQYDGQAVIAISPRPDAPSAGADTVRVGAPKFVSFVEAPKTAAQVSAEVGESRATLEESVNATVPVDTGNVAITVRHPDPQRAAVIANVYARRVLEFAAKDPLLSAQLVAQAIPPTQPAAPPRRLLQAASLIVAVLVGIAVSLLLERGRPRLRSWRDIARATGYPILGRIPRSRILRARPTEAFSDPVTGAAFRTLRANLEPQIRERKIRVLLVTSPGKAEGKTTVSALLAESLGRLGMSVLLVDADLRRPRLAPLAQVDGRPGLSDILRDRVPLERGVHPGWSTDLDLLPTAADPEAGDLLARRFADVMEEAKRKYDIVVIDSPPLLGTDDTRALAPIADGVLIVVAAGSVASPVNEAILAVESLKAPLLGIIGNRIKEARSLYYSS